jgi:hypothetical protein
MHANNNISSDKLLLQWKRVWVGMLSTHPTHPLGFVFLFYSAVYYLLVDAINNTMMQRNSQNCKAVKDDLSNCDVGAAVKEETHKTQHA